MGSSLDEVDELEVDELGQKIKGKIVFYNKAFNQRYINVGTSYGETGFQRRTGAIKAAEHGALHQFLGHYLRLPMKIFLIQEGCLIRRV